ncbi:glycoside hydrolase family 2 [bacterium]|nr:MAG: glycoside hydrolase family 2 [bacterium]
MTDYLPDPNHPRPLMTRAAWRDLSGTWEFAFDDAEVGLAERWWELDELPLRVQVPFAYQYPLSGIDDQSIHEAVWYGLSFEPTEEERAHDLLLHFGAVDYACTVWLNGVQIGGNRGGHVPFSFDIKPYLRPGPNRLVLRVEDRQSEDQPRGKQSSTGIPKSCDYYCTTGIWQRVWLEPVAQQRFDVVKIVPHLNPDRLEVEVHLHAHAGNYRIEVYQKDIGRTKSYRLEGAASTRFTLEVPAGRRWTPETPNLIGLELRLFEESKLLDEIHTYAGVREARVDGNRFLLNGEPTFLKMVLDQGYWPDGGMTPPDGEALRKDVEDTKAMGFNGARKHQKVEDPRWLTWCDRLGLLTWGEMANARTWSFEAEECFTAEWERAVRRDVSHPCVVTWVPINESWGLPDLGKTNGPQYAFLERLVLLTRRLDPSRPVIDNDGWEHTDVGDIAAIHDYTATGDGLRERWGEGRLPERTWGKGSLAHFVGDAKYRGQPIVLSEVGGFLLVPEDVPQEELDRLYQFYGSHRTPEELLAKYRDIMKGLADIGVAGFCYTQLTDIEQEINGLLRYDRTPKVPLEAIKAINDECFG